MSAAAGITRTWKVGRYTCTLTVQRPRPGVRTSPSVIEWAPKQPRGLTPEEIGEYRDGRNKALVEISRELGLSVAVIEA